MKHYLEFFVMIFYHGILNSSAHATNTHLRHSVPTPGMAFPIRNYFSFCNEFTIEFTFPMSMVIKETSIKRLINRNVFSRLFFPHGLLPSEFHAVFLL